MADFFEVIAHRWHPHGRWHPARPMAKKPLMSIKIIKQSLRCTCSLTSCRRLEMKWVLLCPKSHRDVVAYRVRSPQDISGCIMAAYGSSHTLPMRTLQAFGLYGTLVLDEARARFFSIPERIALNGVLHMLLGLLRGLSRPLGIVYRPHMRR